MSDERWSHWRDAELKGIDDPVPLFLLEAGGGAGS